MIIGDYHTHTAFCDGENSPEEMLLSAIDKGLEYYGFSSHSHLAYDESWNMSHDSQKQYVAEVMSLKDKYKDRIRVLLGTEFDLLSDNDLTPFDYIIGSCHSLLMDGEYISVDHSEAVFADCCNRFYGGDAYAFADHYYKMMATAADFDEITFYGHFDLVNKFNAGGKFFDENDPRYTTSMYKTLESLTKTGKPFELNTQHTFRHNPQEASKSARLWLSALYELGGRVVINSDAHTAQRIGYNFDRAFSFLKECGFKSFLVLTEKGFEEVSL